MTTEEIYFGIFIGVVGSAVFAFIVWIVRTAIMPAYLAWRYEGPELKGAWSTHDTADADAPAVGHVDVEQKGHGVKMVNSRTASRSGRRIRRKFEYLGEFYTSHLTVQFHAGKMKGHSTGAMVMHLSADGNLLSGKNTYFDQERNSVVSHDLFMRRKP
jgi:hypothetical protein